MCELAKISMPASWRKRARVEKTSATLGALSKANGMRSRTLRAVIKVCRHRRIACAPGGGSKGNEGWRLRPARPAYAPTPIAASMRQEIARKNRPKAKWHRVCNLSQPHVISAADGIVARRRRAPKLAPAARRNCTGERGLSISSP